MTQLNHDSDHGLPCFDVSHILSGPDIVGCVISANFMSVCSWDVIKSLINIGPKFIAGHVLTPTLFLSVGCAVLCWCVSPCTL